MDVATVSVISNVDNDTSFEIVLIEVDIVVVDIVVALATSIFKVVSHLM